MELKNFLAAILLTGSSISCLKEEIPVPAPLPGDVSIDAVDIGSDYRFQVYYNLSTSQQVASITKKSWDLGFECSSTGNKIILNTAKFMFAAPAESNDPSKVTDTIGIGNWNTDHPTGNLDSTAIGDWTIQKNLYLIDRGVDEGGIHQGFVKVRFVSWDEESYNIQWCNLSENQLREETIPKNPTRNFVSFSFDDDGEVLLLEPEKANWDLLFTQYTEMLDDEGTIVPYLVTGVQINRNGMSAAAESTLAFEDIDLKNAYLHPLKSDVNQPGYSWKVFDFEKGAYTVDPSKVYLIKSADGLYFKLRFTEFYNSKGEKGHPKFEYQRL